jgi:NTP pyrophosphatase (non-canonical NTP hydrolase)
MVGGMTTADPLAVWDEIVAERRRAHAKHGTTSMESCDRFADRRLRVITEEVGEVARVLNDREHASAGTVRDEYDTVAAAVLRAELVQVAAMAVAWIAALDGEALAS